MTTTAVALDSVASAVEERDTPLFKKYLAYGFPRRHRKLEYSWGMDLFTFDEEHELSILRIRPSMTELRWILVPTEETLSAMVKMQSNNFSCPIAQRNSFLAEFSAPEYEYIFVPLDSDVDFFVIESGRPPHRYSSPYLDFPRIRVAANPFFVMLAASSHITQLRRDVRLSVAWQSLYFQLTTPWIRSNLPQDFVLSCFPEDLVSDNGDESDSDSLLTPPSQNGPQQEPIAQPSFKLAELNPWVDKELLISNWIQHDADPNQLSPPSAVCNSPWPPSAPIEQPRPVAEAVFCDPSWYTDSDQGKIYADQYFYPLPE
ncbi:hypothetical protein C8J56DRAFT_166235 [Mycena floridula]|nr:hypothetical protein C8J56DRAFT_166235 [Mycena floridula]